MNEVKHADPINIKKLRLDLPTKIIEYKSHQGFRLDGFTNNNDFLISISLFSFYFNLIKSPPKFPLKQGIDKTIKLACL